MPALTFLLIAIGSWLLFVGKQWAYWLMLAALVTGSVAFLTDVDFSQPLGLQW